MEQGLLQVNIDCTAYQNIKEEKGRKKPEEENAILF